jgi:hypothetical protein
MKYHSTRHWRSCVQNFLKQPSTQKPFDLSLKEEAIKAGNWVLDKFDAPEIIITMLAFLHRGM